MDSGEVVGDGAGGHVMHTGDTRGVVGTGRLQPDSNSGDNDRVVFARRGVVAEDTGGRFGEAGAGSGGYAVGGLCSDGVPVAERREYG